MGMAPTVALPDCETVIQERHYASNGGIAPRANTVAARTFSGLVQFSGRNYAAEEQNDEHSKQTQS